MRHSLILLAAASATALIVSGCARNEAAEPKAAPLPQVSVAPVISRKVTESDEFTGRFEAVERVEIRPRVSGYISSVTSPRGAKSKRATCCSSSTRAPTRRSATRRAPGSHRRTRSWCSPSPSASARRVSSPARDLAGGVRHPHGRARAGASQRRGRAGGARCRRAQRHLHAPDGAHRRTHQPGSGHQRQLRHQWQTPLTTLVSLDPIYVSFDGDEQEYLKYTKLARDTAHGGSREARNPVLVGLADENGYPHPGAIVFVDNALDPAHGQPSANRALLDNRDRVFTPGLFARIRLMGSGQHEAILINDSAIGTDQTVRYVLVVGAGNKVEYRPVQLGPVIDGLRVVQSGLAPGEIIVVNGLQRVRPGAQVAPQRVAMGTRRPGEDAALLASNTTDPAAGSAAP